MNDQLRPAIPIREPKVRRAAKGRQIDPSALEEIQQLLGDAPRRRDLLVEHLHKIQDRYGALADRHLVALAHEMKLAMTEVYEVATFYHHFDVVKDGEAAPPAITVRVCDSLACELAGARELLARLPQILGKDVRVLPAPCIGRCEQAPAATVGQHPVPCADTAKIETLVQRREVTHPAAKDRARFSPDAFIGTSKSPGVESNVSPDYVGYEAYCKAGGYRLIADCLAGKHDV
jgi:formate dehydrogenase